MHILQCCQSGRISFFGNRRYRMKERSVATLSKVLISFIPLACLVWNIHAARHIDSSSLSVCGQSYSCSCSCFCSCVVVFLLWEPFPSPDHAIWAAVCKTSWDATVDSNVKTKFTTDLVQPSLASFCPAEKTSANMCTQSDAREDTCDKKS